CPPRLGFLVRGPLGGTGRPFLWDAPRGAPHATNPDDEAGTPPRPRDEVGLRPMPPAAPIRSCSRWGLPCRPCCQGRGALLPHRFTLARGPRDEPGGRGRFVFCGTFPGVAPAGGWPAPYSRGARTFLCRPGEPGKQRPSGRLAGRDMRAWVDARQAPALAITGLCN